MPEAQYARLGDLQALYSKVLKLEARVDELEKLHIAPAVKRHREEDDPTKMTTDELMGAGRGPTF